jgi:Kef-type K+ transport system membrane component KefB
MEGTFKQSVVTVLMLLIFVGIVAFIRYFLVGKYFRNILQNKYSQEDVRRIEILISAAISIVVIIALVWGFSLF